MLSLKIPLRLSTATLLLAVPIIGGCHTPQRSTTPTVVDVDTARDTVHIFDGVDGSKVSWDDLLAAVDRADIITIGELHNDGVGHAIELLLVEHITKQAPGSAVSLEMLERDEQGLVFDYQDGLIDDEVFLKETSSTDWAGPDSFAAWYLPLIDTAHGNGATVIAANAPRRYVKAARTKGWEELDSIPEPRRSLYAIPTAPPDASYYDRFVEVMGGHGDDPTDPEVIEAIFRAQRLWDETMADSVVNALRQGHPKVIHIVGQFHSDFDGGLVDAIESRAPDEVVLVISMQPRAESALQEDDLGRADYVIYTGALATD